MYVQLDFSPVINEINDISRLQLEEERAAVL